MQDDLTSSKTYIVHINIYDFETRKPEMDNFEKKKKIGSKGYISTVFTDTLEKSSQNILHILLFQNILSIFFYFEKKIV